MENPEKLFNRGFIDFGNVRKISMYDVRCSDVFLCESFVRIPEIGIDGVFISWQTTEDGFFLHKKSCDILLKSGRNIYVNVLGRNISLTKLIVPKMHSFSNLFLYEKFGVQLWFLKDTKYEFTLLNEDRRDFSMNPKHIVLLGKFHTNSEDLSQKLKTDFGDLLKNPVMSDVTLHCSNGCIKAHKNILISRCRFFEKMFAYETIETKTSVVQCHFSIQIMNTVLEYIYKGNIDDSTAYEIYEAADYYDLIELQSWCEKILLQKLVPENAISLLRLADSCNVSELKDYILAYISWNAKYVKESKEYLELLNIDSESILKLVNEAFELPLAKFELDVPDEDDFDRYVDSE